MRRLLKMSSEWLDRLGMSEKYFYHSNLYTVCHGLVEGLIRGFEEPAILYRRPLQQR
jgi:hypothetical protein